MKEKYSIDSVKSSQQRRSSSKTVRSKMKGGHITKQSSGTSSVKPSIPVSSVDISTARKAKTHSSECVPSVKIVNHVAKSSKRHSKMTEGTVKNPPFYSTSQGSNDSSSANCVEPQEEEMKFDLLRDGYDRCSYLCFLQVALFPITGPSCVCLPSIAHSATLFQSKADPQYYQNSLIYIVLHMQDEDTAVITGSRSFDRSNEGTLCEEVDPTS